MIFDVGGEFALVLILDPHHLEPLLRLALVLQLPKEAEVGDPLLADQFGDVVREGGVAEQEPAPGERSSAR